MPRSGDSSTHKIGDKMLEEIRSTFALVFKRVEAPTVDLALNGPLVSYQMDFSPAVSTVTFPDWRPPDHNALRWSGEEKLAVGSVALLAEATVSVGTFRDREAKAHSVTFDGWRAKLAGADANWRVAPPTIPEVRDVEALKNFEGRDNVVVLGAVRPGTKTIAANLSKTQTKTMPPSLYFLPIARHPVPLAHFPEETILRFRKALAEKAGLPTAGVRLKLVYDRFDMSDFQSVAQNPGGSLSFVPKAERVGLRRPEIPAAPTGTFYLVCGSRVESGEPVVALVPREAFVYPEREAGE